MDSLRTLSRYLGHEHRVSLRHDLFAEKPINLRSKVSTLNYVQAKKGLAVTEPIKHIKSQLTDYESRLWGDFKEGLKAETAVQEHKNISDIRIIPEDPWIEDPFVDVDAFLRELCDHESVTIRGGITFGVEGVVSWPLPDPDLLFEWQLSVKATNSFSTVEVSISFIFIRIDGPSWGWILGIIGFLLTGNILGFKTGLKIGEEIDIQYEDKDEEDKVIKELKVGYDALDEFFHEFINSKNVRLARPTEKIYEVVIRVDHVPSAAKGVHGISCGLAEILQWFG